LEVVWEEEIVRGLASPIEKISKILFSR
jgi:hypothetical protein